MIFRRRRIKAESYHEHKFITEDEVSDHDKFCPIRKAAARGECCILDPLFGYPCWCGVLKEVREDAVQDNN